MALPSTRKGIILSPEQSTNEAFESILRSNFDSMLDWAPVAYNHENIEGVHQVRVSLRRLRSAVSIFRKAIPREITDPWNTEMRWVASEFGPTRDLDVFIDEGLNAMAGKIPLQAGEEKLQKLATKHQDAAYANIRTLMESDRYKDFTKNLDQWIRNRGWFQEEMPADIRSNLGKGIARYAKKVLSKRLTVVLRTGEHMEEMSDEALHQLRIECKKLRYATEFFSTLFDPTNMAEFTLQLKEVQKFLGTMNDVAVMPSLLNKILEGVHDPDVQQYAGALLGWRCHEAASVRRKLHAPWKVFSKTASPWQKR